VEERAGLGKRGARAFRSPPHSRRYNIAAASARARPRRATRELDARATRAKEVPAISTIAQPAAVEQRLESLEATLPGDTPDLSWRVLSVLNLFRILVASALIALFYLIDRPRVLGGESAMLFVLAGFTYLLGSVASVYTLSRRVPAFTIQVIGQLIIDVVAISALMHASGGIQSGLGNLLLVSVGAASVTVTTRMAAMFAALAAIVVLFEQALSQLQGITSQSDYTATGLLGATLFVIALATQPLARRIRESEALAAQRGVDLENLAELNDYVIQNLRESIVVIDGQDRIRLMNESAAKVLSGGSSAVGRSLRELSPELHAHAAAWREDPSAAQAGVLSFPAHDGSTLITPHFAPLGRKRPAAALIFLEDASLFAERVQQEKLAALGRLTASIAHEIRNPVGAMSHAGQLLGESATLGEQERRLTAIIHKNAERISTIVENVLQLSRRDQTRPERLTLAAWLQEFAAEFRATHELKDGELVVTELEPNLEVQMDPSHLHQVLWNLCDNCLKYASEHGGRVVELRSGRVSASGRPFLEVADRGPGIDEALRERIFEPFVTTTRGGTGLGLFIARQLCESNGASLRYEARPGGGSIFRIVFADPQRWAMGG
jgi:two-component system sensor histidine kinase PilS (NtrC family)